VYGWVSTPKKDQFALAHSHSVSQSASDLGDTEALEEETQELRSRWDTNAFDRKTLIPLR